MAKPPGATMSCSPSSHSTTTINLSALLRQNFRSTHRSDEFGFKQYAIPKIVKAFFENFRPSIDANSKLRFAPPIKKDGMETIMIQEAEVIEQKMLPVSGQEKVSAGTKNFPVKV